MTRWQQLRKVICAIGGETRWVTTREIRQKLEEQKEKLFVGQKVNNKTGYLDLLLLISTIRYTGWRAIVFIRPLIDGEVKIKRNKRGWWLITLKGCKAPKQ